MSEVSKPKSDTLSREICERLYWQEGYSLEDIGEMFELTRNQVYRQFLEWGMPTRKKTDRTKRSRDKMRTKYKGIRGKATPNWKGGEQKDAQGYVRIWNPEHPQADNKGYVRRSHLIIEKILGRYLRPKEVAHHINGIKDDDRIENLMVLSASAHASIHYDVREKVNIKKVSFQPVPEEKKVRIIQKYSAEIMTCASYMKAMGFMRQALKEYHAMIVGGNKVEGKE